MNRIYTFNESKKIFAENLKELMDKKKYTIESLAKKTGYSEISIKKWRAGDRIPTFETLAKLAKVFKTTIQKLYLPKSYYEKDITPEFLDFLYQQREESDSFYIVQEGIFEVYCEISLSEFSQYRKYILKDNKNVIDWMREEKENKVKISVEKIIDYIQWKVKKEEYREEKTNYY